LKENITIVSVLTIPNPHSDFAVSIDASLEGLGGVLSQMETQ